MCGTGYKWCMFLISSIVPLFLSCPESCSCDLWSQLWMSKTSLRSTLWTWCKICTICTHQIQFSRNHSICMCTSDSVQNKVCMHFIQYAHIKISSEQKQSVHCIIHDDMQRISLTFESINKQEWKISTMTVMKWKCMNDFRYNKWLRYLTLMQTKVFVVNIVWKLYI